MPSQKNIFYYGKDFLTPSVALDICRNEISGVIDAETREKIIRSHQEVKKIVASGKIVYGINTGFGSLCQTIISREDTNKLQENLLRSHSVGVGDPVPDEIVRLMLILKIHSLSFGYSGIDIKTVERILWLLNHNYLPLVPSKGSLGASGDLTPLAHLFLPLIGLGEIKYNEKYIAAADVYKQEGMEPILLGPKEGLALINGTQFITAFTIKIIEQFCNCLEVADIIGAMTLEGLLGSAKPFEDEIHQLRPFKGVLHVAHRMKIFLQGSEMVASHASCGRVQDPYSIRCIPQVHGASRNAWEHLNQLAQIEMNSITDNPVIFEAQKTISGGNFHAQPLAMPLDYCGLAAAELGNISERRTNQLLQGGIEGLPELLMRDTGINSGFMIPQYTAAALVSENKSLCYPASADSIPTSLGQEDHVSMGSISARKTYQIIQNLELILAVELLCAAQAFDYRRPMRSGSIIEACHNMIREKIDHAEEDRIFAQDIREVHKLITSGILVSKTYEIAENENIDLKGEYHEEFGIY
jgi:histidine ammonia-lyase